MKVLRLYTSELGGDVQKVDIYHTLISSGTLLEAAVTASRLTTGDGVEVRVPDNINNFIAYNSDPLDLCYTLSGSLTTNTVRTGTRFFGVEGWGDGQVGSNNTALTSSFSESVDYREPGTTFTIKGVAQFPTEVQGFYYDGPPFTEENFIGTGDGTPQEKYLSFNELTEYTGSETDTIWVKFSTGSGSMDYYYNSYYGYDTYRRDPNE